MPHKNKTLIIIAIIAIFVLYKNSYIWFQKANTEYLIKYNQSTRVFPHRVNTIGKLNDIWNSGFRSFEVDIYFDDHNKKSFILGHNKGEMGGSLETLLSSIEYQEIHRIWLDFKNLNENNYYKALKKLKYLDNKFNIKKNIILESSTTLKIFKEFEKDGWHISYYIPTAEVSKHLKNNDIEKLKQLASSIARQSKVQNLSAISFDNSLYDFIKQYLEPLINQNIVYHTWWGPKLYRYNFQNKLNDNALFKDKRVKTILVQYKSKHHL